MSDRNSQIDLNNLIICKKCDTLHEKKRLKEGAVAKCTECGAILYRHHKNMIDFGLAIGLSALIFFIIANSFDIVQIDLRGIKQSITLPSVLFSLFENGYLIVGIFCTLVIFLFPFTLLVIYIWIMYLLKIKEDEEMIEKLLINLSKLLPWSMSEIFLISIFVALIKLVGYAQIHFGISLVALSIFVGLNIYLTKTISLDEIWTQKEKIFRNKDG
jgi:paraquat-inducible protein A